MRVIQELIRDDYTFEQARSLQIKYNALNIQLSEKYYIKEIHSIKTIAGVDISYFKKKNQEYGFACAIVWDFKKGQLVDYYFAEDRIMFPYKPGFLGFRECKLLVEVISKLPEKPDLIMCDGHGKIHPRNFGEAVQLGFALDIPSIGIAKKFFIGYLDQKKSKKIKGYKTQIWAHDPNNLLKKQPNEILGYKICLSNGSRPVYISAGYKITLALAIQVSLISTKDHRQPEPLYMADFLSRNEVKKKT
ncbi:MAG: endonuclease V [Candidatus Thorarchaeota archaeon]